MRSILLTFAYVIFYASLSAQGVFSNKTQTVLEKVIQDSANKHYSWTYAVSNTRDFKQAKTKFLEIYKQICNSIITTSGQKTFILTGQYEDPEEEKSCTQVIFSLLPEVGEGKKLKVELCIRKENKDWKVLLSVYDRDSNDHDPKEESQGAVTVTQ